jgi:hypothetical protein
VAMGLYLSLSFALSLSRIEKVNDNDIGEKKEKDLMCVFTHSRTSHQQQFEFIPETRTRILLECHPSPSP